MKPSSPLSCCIAIVLGVTTGTVAGIGSAEAADTAAVNGGSESLNEIIVTATRREERLQDVPISISAFTQETLNQASVHTPDELFRLTPGVLFTSAPNQTNGQSNQISIRGINSAAGYATTGIYVDDTPIQSRLLQVGTYNAYPNLFDLDHVEVLRGPQGTLFGAGSEGGNVRFIQTQPDLTRASGFARVEGGFIDGGGPIEEVGAAYGEPIVDGKLAFRASASYRMEGGYIDHYDWHTGEVTSPNSNWTRNETARLAVKWAPTDSVTVSPSIYYQEAYINDASYYWRTLPSQPTYDEFHGQFRDGSAVKAPSDDKFYLPAIRFDWDLGPAKLISNSSYFGREQHATTDYTNFDRAIFTLNPFAPAGSAAPVYWEDNQSNFTQEIRLESTAKESPLTWTLGMFYQRAHEDTVQNIYDPNLPHDVDTELGNPPGTWVATYGPLINGYALLLSPVVSVDTQKAIFGQAEYRITDKLSAAVGLRVTRTDYTTLQNYRGPIFGSALIQGSESETPVTPKYQLTYKFTPDNMVYASAAKGFRIGGINTPLQTSCDAAAAAAGFPNGAPKSFSSDTVWSYEIGTKNAFADRRILIDVDTYVINWTNIQQQLYLQTCGGTFFDNLGSVRSHGVDLQTEMHPSESTAIGLVFSYNDAYFNKTLEPVGATAPIVSDGDRLPAWPYTVNLWASYSYPAFGGSLYGRIDYQYNEQQTKKTQYQNPNDIFYYQPVQNVAEESLLNLRAGVKWERYDVSLYVQNATNSHPIIHEIQDVSTPTGGTPLWYDYTIRPRVIGLTGMVHF